MHEKIMNMLSVKTIKNRIETINFKTEILAGLTVTMTMIPESLSFAILAGLTPIIGLYAAFIMGLVTAILGGRPGMVSGGAGATVIVLIALISQYGVEYLFATIILAGILQILVGVFKLAKFIRLIPQSVIYGFLNGLAVVIFIAQLEQFKYGSGDSATWMSGMMLWKMVGLVLMTIGIVLIFPKITKMIPASLVAIIVVSLLVYFFQIDTKKVVDIAGLGGSLPTFHFPSIPFTFDTMKIIFPYALIMSMVGLIESLLTLNIVDEMTETKGSSNKESVAQGTANILNGFFGGMGGCAMIAQTLINIQSGARGRLSAIIGSLSILIIILVASPIIEQIPMAALVGVMMVVAISTFQWAFFRFIRKMPKSDIFVGILVALITIFLHNLALAVLIGVIISALVFAWDNARRIPARKSFNEKGEKVYEIYGPLFFGSTMAFLEKFDVKNDPSKIIIDFKESRVADMSAINALHTLAEKYQKQGKLIVLKHLSADSVRLLRKAEYLHVERDENNDPSYQVMK